MKVPKLLITVIFLVLVFVMGWSNMPVQAEELLPGYDYSLFLPVVTSGYTPVDHTIIVDHRNTDVSQIPPYWRDEARKFVVHYAHTSHGSQVLTGLEWLEGRDLAYNVDIIANGLVVNPSEPNALGIYDGNNYDGDTYIVPEMYWATLEGFNHTRQVADTGWFDFSLWTWCGQMSDASTQVQDYLDVMNQLELIYPGMRFIYYTGHTDGSAPGSTLWQHNNMVRQYAQDHDKVLFDFADIESYDPNGVFHPTASDACEWCDDWCSDHPSNFECQDLPETDSECAHTNGLQCTLKGQAFWWMLARLAGWGGTP
jgi:hypothetical protein